MYLKYGNYTFDDNIVDLSQITAQRMYSPRNRLAFTRYTMACQGHFCVSGGQSAIKAKLQAFERALRDDWKDVGLYHDDGTKSAHWLSNARSINGVRVVNVAYPSVEAEYATGRSFSLTFQADYLNVEDQIWSFNESLQFIGGCGPAWTLDISYSGPPQPRILAKWTVQKIIQRGSVVGLEAPPLIPAPLLPANYEHNDQRSIERQSAQKIGRHSNLLFPVEYRYVYSSGRPLNFYPRPDYPGR